MRKRKQKAIRAPKIPKAPDPIVSAQPNHRELKDPKARRLGMSALSASDPGMHNTSNLEALSVPNPTSSTNHANAVDLNTADTSSVPKNLDNIKSIILSSPNLSTAYQTLRRQRVKNTTFNVNSIQSYPELIAALEAKAVQITLGANIIAPDNILINHDVAINFNGYNIISEETNPGARVLDIRSGEVTLTGKGKIFAMGARSVAIRVFGAISIGMPAYTTLTIDDGISIFAPDSYGILISPNLGVAYGLIINLSGEIIARDGIGLSSHIRGRDVNLPTINIRSGARITADETCGSALEAAGYAAWNIGAAKLTGATGALLKSGQINFSHTEIIATGEAYSSAAATVTEVQPEDSQEARLEDPAPANAAIRVASAAKHDLNIAIEGGSYLGEKSFAIAGDPSSLESFVIKGGDFSGALDVLHYIIEPELEIEEGSFSLHPALHLKILKPEIVLLPEPEPEPYPKEIIEAMRPVPQPADKPSRDVPADANPSASHPLQKLPLPPTYDEAECAEKIAMTKALADAIIEMKNLKASDYEVGFADLEAAIRSAEQLLSAKIITLAAIRDASAKLLAAFDNLEERDEFSLTDDELDELFYHGAVLDELAADPKTTSEPAPSPEKASEPTAKPQPTLNSGTVSAPNQSTTSIQSQSNISIHPQPNAQVPNQQPAAPDFSTLASIIAQISALNPSDYAPAAYNILLSELVQVKSLLASATQPQIDIAVQNLSTLLANLTRTAHNNSLAHYFVDEMVPTRNWSTGVASIDESDPHLCISRPLPKSLRRQVRLDFSPIANFVKSFSAAFRAGLDVYQKTRRTAKTN